MEWNTYSCDTNQRRQQTIGRDASVKIVFLSASSGGGHHAVAQSLTKLIVGAQPATCHTIDLYADKKLNIFPKFATMRAKLPTVWAIFLWCTHRPQCIQFLWLFFKRRFVRSVKLQLAECPVDKPDIIIATHHAAGHCLSEIAGLYEIKPKTIVFVTDYGLHQSWIADTDLTIVASALAYKELKQQGRRVLPIPLLPCEGGSANTMGIHRTFKAKLKESASDYIYCVALMGLDGTSEKKLKALLATLDKQDFASRLSIDIICGKNVLLNKQLAQWQWARLQVKVLGFVSDVPERLRRADLALLRLSPQIMTESLVASTPIIAFDWHYHERQNVQVLRRFGAGDGSLNLVRQIDLVQVFCQNAKYRRQWQQAAARVSSKRIEGSTVIKILNMIKALPEKPSKAHASSKKNLQQAAANTTSTSSINSY